MRARRAGELITETIRLVRPLGQGGMGLVWIAEHLALRTHVVVKMLTDHLANSREAHERFQREAAAASLVRSPHVVHVMDYGVTPDGLPFIAMELLDGDDLAQRLARERTLAPRKVAAIVTQVARTLTRAHERGVVHRDIKPENIFLSDVGGDDAFVKVLDFGIAKATSAALGSATQTGAMLGTPYYMSPEQVLGARDVDARTDVWSLGVVAFEALTGQRPFDGDNVGAIAVAICHGELPRPSSVRPDLPHAVDVWFEMACARDRDTRFASARTAAAALEAAVGGLDKISLRPTADASANLPAIVAPLPARRREDRATHDAVARTSMTAPRTRWILVPSIVAAGVLGGVAAFSVTHRGAPAIAHAGSSPAIVEAGSHEAAARPEPGPIAAPPVASTVAAVSASASPPIPKVASVASLPAKPPKADLPKASATPSASTSGTGRVVVSASGGWCDAALDGKPLGPTPTGFVDATAGAHVVTCVVNGATLRQTIVVTPGEIARVKLRVL